MPSAIMKKLILLAAFCAFFTGGLQAASYHGLYRGNYYLESHRSGYYYETGFFVVHVDKRDRATVWLGSTYANNNADEQAVEKLTFSLNSEGWGKFKTHNRYYVSCQINPDGTITVASLEEDVDIYASDTEYVPWGETSYESGKYSISGKVSQYGYSVSVSGEALILPDGDSYLYLSASGAKAMERIGLYNTGYSVAAEPIVSLDYVSLQVGKLQLKVHYVEPVDNITVDLTLSQRESFFDTDADGVSNYDEIAFGTDETLTDTDKTAKAMSMNIWRTSSALRT